MSSGPQSEDPMPSATMATTPIAEAHPPANHSIRRARPVRLLENESAVPGAGSPGSDTPPLVEPTAARATPAATATRPRNQLTSGGARLNIGDLERGELHTGTHPGDRYVRRVRASEVGFKRVGPGHLEALPATIRPTTGAGRVFDRLKRFFIGRPLSTAASVHERLSKVKALAVLSSDALSSVAYATEAVLATLLLAGTGAFVFNISISIAIAILIGIVIFSYRQTIFAYPKGGGSYIVSKDNLGTGPGLIAGASLLTDYILTVSVSISAGIANLISLAANLGAPDLSTYRVEIALAAVLIVVLLNLRGIRESGTIFAAPTYVFLFLVFSMMGLGLYQWATGSLGTVTNIPNPYPTAAVENLGLFVLLRAFASGCTALTGIEAISDGVPAFQKPESKNAAITLVTLGVLLTTMFLGISFLADNVGVQISHTETVISQLGRTIFGSGAIGGVFYGGLLVFTSLILVLAANTAFSDFPRLGFFLARDKFLPHQFAFRGDRLAYSVGIVTLGIMSSLLIVVFGGKTDALLPLYAIGVFSSFTLSQSGMVVRWWRTRPAHWRFNLGINLIGALTTFLVLLVLAITKFIEGAWIVLVIVPLLVLLFLRINKHYQKVAGDLSLQQVTRQMGRAAVAGVMMPTRAIDSPLEDDAGTATEDLPPSKLNRPMDHLVIIPIAGLNQVTLRTIAYARSITPNVVGVHVAGDEEAEETAKLEARWHEWIPEIPLVMVESPYRSLTRPLLAYIDALHQQQPDRVLSVVLPEFVPAHWWEHLLHNQTALRLKGALLGRPGIVVTSVPYHLAREPVLEAM